MEYKHILVCISSSPSNEKIIKAAADMANSLNCPFSALFVETSNYSKLSTNSKLQLQKNIQLAASLNAKVETVVGDDIPYQIAEFARQNNITILVIGRNSNKKLFFHSNDITDKVIDLVPNLDVHIIPDVLSNSGYNELNKGSISLKKALPDIIKSIIMLSIASIIGNIFYITKFSEANIITIYILAVVLVAVNAEYLATSLACSFVTVFIYNFFFTAPRFTLRVYDPGTIVTFAVMFTSAFLTSSLATRLKNNAKTSAEAAYRTKILFDTSQLLEKAKEKNEILECTAIQLQKLLNRTVVLFPEENNTLSNPLFYFSNNSNTFKLTSSDYEAANWTFINKKQSGATTERFNELLNYYLSIRSGNRTFGVVGININNEPLGSFEQSILLSILTECALALENELNRRIVEEETIKVQKEELRANLLRAISHDLRTPLTSISGNAYNLLTLELDDASKNQTLNDIYDDSQWLITLVENLLSVTRIEDGKMQINYSTELLSDIVNEALNHVSRKKDEHTIVTDIDEYLLVYVDTRLILQVFMNLIDNAIKHTPIHSTITIKAFIKDNKAFVQVIDDGDGIKDEEKEKVFEMFYTTSNKIADSKRSMGMGLPLCKSILNSHNQSITIKDNNPHGSIFEFTLPIKEVHIHE